MDALTIVVSALIAGLTSGVTETAKTAVIDSYSAFKAHLQSKLENHSDAKEAVTALEKKPESKGRQATLKEELAALEIEKDIEIVSLAKKFLEQLDEKGAEDGKYKISIENAQGVVIGDNANVKQTFIQKPKR